MKIKIEIKSVAGSEGMIAFRLLPHGRIWQVIKPEKLADLVRDEQTASALQSHAGSRDMQKK